MQIESAETDPSASAGDFYYSAAVLVRICMYVCVYFRVNHIKIHSNNKTYICAIQ